MRSFRIFLLLPLLPLCLSSQSLPFMSGVGRFQQQSRAYQCVESGNKLVFTGWSGGNPANADVSLIQTDADGDTVWIRHYSGTGNEHGRGLLKSPSGGFIIGGFTTSYGTGGEDMLLIKTDANGDTIFTRTFGGPQGDAAWSICRSFAYGGGYVLCGYTSSYGVAGKDVFLVRTDLNGNLIWAKTFGSWLDEEGFDIQETSSKELIITGYSSSFVPDSMNVFVLKADSSGTEQWTKNIGNPFDDYGKAVSLSGDGNILIAGYGKDGTMYEDCWLIKLDQQGNTLWKNYYGGPMFDSFYDVTFTRDSGICAVGYTNFFGGGGQDAMIIRMDGNGDTLWTRAYGGSGCDEAYGILETADSGFIISGYEQSFFSGTRTMYLIRIAANGNGINCNSYAGALQYGALSAGDLFVNFTVGSALPVSGHATLDLIRGNYLDRFCSPGGILNETEEGGVKIFPNPASSCITLLFEKELNVPVNAMLMDISGRTIKTMIIREGTKESIWSLDGLEAGVYMLNFDGRGTIRLITY